MSTSSRFVPGLALGLVVGGFGGGVSGYVAHDLLEKPNPEVMQQIEQAEQTQQGVDDFLNSLAAPPPAAPSTAPAAPSGGVPAPVAGAVPPSGPAGTPPAPEPPTPTGALLPPQPSAAPTEGSAPR